MRLPFAGGAVDVTGWRSSHPGPTPTSLGVPALADDASGVLLDADDDEPTLQHVRDLLESQGGA